MCRIYTNDDIATSPHTRAYANAPSRRPFRVLTRAPKTRSNTHTAAPRCRNLRLLREPIRRTYEKFNHFYFPPADARVWSFSITKEDAVTFGKYDCTQVRLYTYLFNKQQTAFYVVLLMKPKVKLCVLQTTRQK